MGQRDKLEFTLDNAESLSAAADYFSAATTIVVRGYEDAFVAKTRHLKIWGFIGYLVTHYFGLVCGATPGRLSSQTTADIPQRRQ